MSTRYNMFYFCIFSILLLLPAQSILAQVQYYGSYPTGKIVLNDGIMLEGKDLEYTNTSVTMKINGAYQNFELSEVRQIMV